MNQNLKKTPPTRGAWGPGLSRKTWGKSVFSMLWTRVQRQCFFQLFIGKHLVNQLFWAPHMKNIQTENIKQKHKKTPLAPDQDLDPQSSEAELDTVKHNLLAHQKIHLRLSRHGSGGEPTGWAALGCTRLSLELRAYRLRPGARGVFPIVVFCCIFQLFWRVYLSPKHCFLQAIIEKTPPTRGAWGPGFSRKTSRKSMFSMPWTRVQRQWFFNYSLENIW